MGKDLEHVMISGKRTLNVFCVGIRIVEELTLAVIGVSRFGGAMGMEILFIEYAAVTCVRVTFRESEAGSNDMRNYTFVVKL